MTNFLRGDSGRFTYKSDEPRKVRSVNLTDGAWEFLLRAGEDNGMSRNDFLETLAQRQQYPFMEVEENQSEPIMETVQIDTATALNRLREVNPKLKLKLKDLEQIASILRGDNP